MDIASFGIFFSLTGLAAGVLGAIVAARSVYGRRKAEEEIRDSLASRTNALEILRNLETISKRTHGDDAESALIKIWPEFKESISEIDRNSQLMLMRAMFQESHEGRSRYWRRLANEVREVLVTDPEEKKQKASYPE